MPARRLSLRTGGPRAAPALGLVPEGAPRWAATATLRTGTRDSFATVSEKSSLTSLESFWNVDCPL
ncbi:hypothetical protein GCM10010485_34250 [Streptosporangium carneum]